MGLYGKLGLPGTVGSMDCTHVLWSNAAKNVINSSRGKEKKATLAFQVVCTHTRLITYCSKYFFGKYFLWFILLMTKQSQNKTSLRNG